MAKTKTKIPAANLSVPQSDEEAVTAVRTVGDLQREIERINADCAQRCGAITDEAAKAVLPIRRQQDEAVEGLKIFCEAHRARLTGDGRTKTVEFATGKVMWRHRPPKVTLRDKIEVIIERIRAIGAGAEKFLRPTIEINKEAMLAAPALASSIAGVSIGSAGEDFIVEPLQPDMPEAPKP